MHLFDVALAHHRAGRVSDAQDTYLEIIQAEPNNSAALSNLAVLYLQGSNPGSINFNRALEILERSLQLNINQPFAHNSLANALFAAEFFEKSDFHYLAAIECEPNYLEAYINRTLLLKKWMGNVAAMNWLSQFQRRFSEDGSYWMAIGALLQDACDYQSALNAFDKVISLKPGAAEAWFNRGNALRMLRRIDEALVSYRRSLKINPTLAEAFINIGVIQQDQKLLVEAVASYDAALKIRPSLVNAQYNRALALENMGSFDAAVSGYGETLKLSPAYPYVMGRMHHARMQMCDWNDFEAHRSMLCTAVESGFPSSVPFPFLAMADDLNLQRLCAETYVKDKFPEPKELDELKTQLAGRRIRIGYLSSDFRTHAVGFLTAGLFEFHNRDEFEVFAISLAMPPEGDAYTARIKAAVEHYVDLSAVPDSEAGAQLRALGLDIAIDLAGHTMDARTGLFARRVAPVQVNYLGYPGSMGASYIDVILADEKVIPLGAESTYAEQVVRLPVTFQINDRQRQINQPKSRVGYGLPDEGFVFASFNTSYKINPPLFDIWCRLLQAKPGSVLWLFGENEAQVANLRLEAAKRGVLAERLIFAGRLPYADHLARYAHVDLVLDTLPFNGGTSTSDALWGGAPVITCMGKSFAGRMSASLLHAVGLPELITESLEDYETLGKTLVTDTSKLAVIKGALKANRLVFPLFDTETQTRHLENVYRGLVSRTE